MHPAYPQSLLAGDEQKLTDDQLKALDQLVSSVLCDGRTNAQISRAIVRHVNETIPLTKIYTVFREDHDEMSEGEVGMWDRSFRSRDDAKAVCEDHVCALAIDLGKDGPDMHWNESEVQQDCWLLNDSVTGTMHTVMESTIE